MRLFDANGLYTKEAAEISEAVKSALMIIMSLHSKVDVRDLTLVVQNAAADATIDYVLERRPAHWVSDSTINVDLSDLSDL